MPKKWERDAQRKRHNEHLERVRNMRSAVDNKMPKQPPKDRRREIEHQRYLVRVEKGNRLLLDRLGEALEGKNIDNELSYVQGYKSLAAVARRQQLHEITTENLRMLDRIRNTDPVYNVMEYELEAEKRDTILKGMSEFPDMYKPKYKINPRLQNLRRKYLEQSQSSGITIETMYDNRLSGHARTPSFRGSLDMMEKTIFEHPPQRSRESSIEKRNDSDISHLGRNGEYEKPRLSSAQSSSKPLSDLYRPSGAITPPEQPSPKMVARTPPKFSYQGGRKPAVARDAVTRGESFGPLPTFSGHGSGKGQTVLEYTITDA
jgi:hypothetical protein